jgi:hypothetical protein
MQKHAKTCAKVRIEPCFDVFMRNSLPTAAQLREILYSHSLRMRAILVNMSQKIAKPQANAGASNGRFQANI